MDDSADGSALVHDEETAADTEGEYDHPAGIHEALRKCFKKVHQRGRIGLYGVIGIGIDNFPSGGGIGHFGVFPGGDDIAQCGYDQNNGV